MKVAVNVSIIVPAQTKSFIEQNSIKVKGLTTVSPLTLFRVYKVKRVFLPHS